MFILGLIILFFLIHLLKEFFPEKLKSNFYFFGIFLLTALLFFAENKNIYLISLFIFFLDTSLLIERRYSLFIIIKTIFSLLALKYISINFLMSQIPIIIFTYLLSFLTLTKEKNLKETFELLLKKSKELNIIRKTSLMLQKSLDYDELIEVLLNTLISKEALNYDRAIIFLFDERLNEFIPYYLHSKIQKEKIYFHIKNDQEYFLKEYRIPNTILNPFGKAFDTKEPIVVNNIDCSDSIQDKFFLELGLVNFGLLPLIEQNHIKGIIMVDNFISKITIENQDLDNTISIIHQASTALINSSLYKQSQNMAYTDSLTGLFNKRYLDFIFEQNLGKLLGKEASLALLIIDVDYFKNYNDINGHIAGNIALQKISELLLAESRNKDSVVRFGGEEFCILLFDIDKKGALGVAERMRNHMEKEVFYNEEKQPKVQLTISIGLAMYTFENTIEELVDKADKALYEAKKTGRNKIVFYEGGNNV